MAAICATLDSLVGRVSNVIDPSLLPLTTFPAIDGDSNDNMPKEPLYAITVGLPKDLGSKSSSFAEGSTSETESDNPSTSGTEPVYDLGLDIIDPDSS